VSLVEHDAIPLVIYEIDQDRIRTHAHVTLVIKFAIRTVVRTHFKYRHKLGNLRHPLFYERFRYNNERALNAITKHRLENLDRLSETHFVAEHTTSWLTVEFSVQNPLYSRLLVRMGLDETHFVKVVFVRETGRQKRIFWTKDDLLDKR
jgi:hypothetical protein